MVRTGRVRRDSLRLRPSDARGRHAACGERGDDSRGCPGAPRRTGGPAGRCALDHRAIVDIRSSRRGACRPAVLFRRSRPSILTALRTRPTGRRMATLCTTIYGMINSRERLVASRLFASWGVAAWGLCFCDVPLLHRDVGSKIPRSTSCSRRSYPLTNRTWATRTADPARR